MQYAAAPGTYMGNSPSTLATYSFLTWRVRICVSISRAFAGFRPNISSPEVSRSSLRQYTYQWCFKRGWNEGSRRFHNHGEGPY